MVMVVTVLSRTLREVFAISVDLVTILRDVEVIGLVKVEDSSNHFSDVSRLCTAFYQRGESGIENIGGRVRVVKVQRERFFTYSQTILSDTRVNSIIFGSFRSIKERKIFILCR